MPIASPSKHRWPAAFLTGLLLGLTLTVASAAEPWTSDEAMLRQVAKYMTAKTTETSGGGQPGIVISEFNGWHYWTLMMYEGMNRMGTVLPEPLFQRYAPERLDFLAGRFARKDKLEKPLRFYSAWTELWCTGLANQWLDRALATKGDAYLDYVNRFRAFVDTCPRVDGLLANNGTQIRTDDAYLMVPPMLRLAALDGSTARTTDALNQLVGYHQRLFQPGDELYRHIWESKDNTYAAAYWGRGNGWMALAFVDVLDFLPQDHPRRAEVLKMYHDQMKGVRRHQATEGGWRQVMDHPEAWVETSCTGMFTYALARGVNEGWLDDSYGDDARKGWKALLGKVDPEGVTIDTCPGTGPGNLEHYLKRPRTQDDPHSYGPILLAGSEILKLKSRK